MTTLSFFSPFLRRLKTFLVLFVIFLAAFWGLSALFPSYVKTTVFYSIKTVAPQVSAGQISALDPVESASKVAEMIAGWAQNPAFRDQILRTAGVEIPRFKHKISARKQNNLNVFWTVKLTSEEAVYTDKIISALKETFVKNFADYNEKNNFPFEASAPMVFGELSELPLLWRGLAVIFLALVFSFGGLYLFEALTDRVSFLERVVDIFPETPILRVRDALGKQNPKLLEQFILTFESPRLIATFKGAEKFFQLAPMDSIDEERDTPVFLVQLGQTKQSELENLLAVFGDEVGVIVFEK